MDLFHSRGELIYLLSLLWALNIEAQTKQGSISLKPKACEDINPPFRSGAKQSGGLILHTNQLFNSDECND